jgi:hypothetical protein
MRHVVRGQAQAPSWRIQDTYYAYPLIIIHNYTSTSRSYSPFTIHHSGSIRQDPSMQAQAQAQAQAHDTWHMTHTARDTTHHTPQPQPQTPTPTPLLKHKHSDRGSRHQQASNLSAFLSIYQT